MRYRALISYAVLLFLPAIGISLLAARLLAHEEERIGRTVRDAVTARAAALADTVDAAVGEARSELQRVLAGMAPAGRAAELRRWEASSPLVRNVFAWRPAEGRVLPDPAEPMTREEAAFAERFGPLFRGEVPWRAPPGEAAAGPAAPGKSARRELKELAAGIRPAAGPVDAAGWIPWFDANQLHLLGWVRRAGEDEVYGVEVEMATLLARILPVLPSAPPAGGTLALLDGEGRPVWQAGDADLAARPPPEASVPVGSSLPHWRAAFFAPPGWNAGVGRPFRVLSVFVVGGFLAAMLAGGGLLLREARRQWRDAARKTSFVSNVSHELKTPLTTIRMYAELLEEGRVADDARRRDYLSVIVSESGRLTRLVNNVLDFSRLEQHRKTYRPARFDLVPLVRAVVEQQRLRIEQAGLRLEVELPAPAAEAWVDRDAFEQVLLNLLDNAVKYAAAGGSLRVQVRAAPRGWELAVLDRGPGVPRAERERVFGMFHRVETR